MSVVFGPPAGSPPRRLPRGVSESPGGRYRRYQYRVLGCFDADQVAYLEREATMRGLTASQMLRTIVALRMSKADATAYTNGHDGPPPPVPGAAKAKRRSRRKK